MQLPVVTLLTAALAATGVSASPVPAETSPNPLAARQGVWWTRDTCEAAAGGTVIGGSTLWMLRNTWNNRFGGDFGGSLGNGEIKGVCCWGQCLWVRSYGEGRRWNGDPWGDALRRLTNVVGSQQPGFCGARINNDNYLVLHTAQHNKVSHRGQAMGVFLGDTCNGRPPW